MTTKLNQVEFVIDEITLIELLIRDAQAED
jgi:hypothetical protein